WAIGVAREAHDRAGQERELSLGAFIQIAATDDIDRGRALLSSTVAVLARFSSLHGTLVGPARAAHVPVYEAISEAYDSSRHAEHAAHAAVLPADFIDDLAVVGPPATCVERLEELVDLGLDHLLIASPTYGVELSEQKEL